MAFTEEIYLKLSDQVYDNNSPQNIDGWERIDIAGFSDGNGFYIDGGFACAAYQNGDEIIISIRGTDGKEGDYLQDLQIILGNVPTTYYNLAQNFYDAVKAQHIDSSISFTGHSLGGGIAQLMGVKSVIDGDVCKTVTFNAPGMHYALEGIGGSESIIYANIDNYVVMNDYVGNFRAHAGYTYYIQPVPINDEPLYNTHNVILQYDESIHGTHFSKPVGFGTKEALALWYYDVNNDDAVIKALVSTQVNENDLNNAINIINNTIGTPINKLHYSVPFDVYAPNDYIIDNNESSLLIGQEKDILGGNDHIWGNEGNDTLKGLSGNDVLSGGQGNDKLYGGEDFDTYVFEKGDGQDVIIDSDGKGKIVIKNPGKKDITLYGTTDLPYEEGKWSGNDLVTAA